MEPAALGLRLHKPTPNDWPFAEWAVVQGRPERVVASGTIRSPRSYNEADALRHLHEGVIAVVREHKATQTYVWEVEHSARPNNALRPRFRAEGVASVASVLAGSPASLVVWATIRSATSADRDKDAYKKATDVSGVAVGEADPWAVLAALAALRG